MGMCWCVLAAQSITVKWLARLRRIADWSSTPFLRPRYPFSMSLQQFHNFIC